MQDQCQPTDQKRRDRIAFTVDYLQVDPGNASPMSKLDVLVLSGAERKVTQRGLVKD
jgi:hypothetical protein